MVRRFKQLDCWKYSQQLGVEVYQLTSTFPSSEKFGLVSQMRRCAISISSNIAEACSRKSNKELYHFLSISIGSAYELDSQLILSTRLNFMTDRDYFIIHKTLKSTINLTAKFRKTFDT